ncbi:MAG TPA: transposase [Opitutaceae bacterium]|nr:transposase [Opitutaceae bacterium]
MSVVTTRFSRGKLPHWEIKDGRYFLTVRLADSIPREAALRLQEVHASLASIEPKSAQFAQLQRHYFLSLEKYLDSGIGGCLLREPQIARIVVEELECLDDWHVEVAHRTIMPNHWHALIVPSRNCAHSLGEIMKRVKGRSALRIRRALGNGGAVWQREWFDRWVRTESEWERMVRYVRNNPVKAGLVADWSDHLWTK